MNNKITLVQIATFQNILTASYCQYGPGINFHSPTRALSSQLQSVITDETNFHFILDLCMTELIVYNPHKEWKVIFYFIDACILPH